MNNNQIAYLYGAALRTQENAARRGWRACVGPESMAACEHIYSAWAAARVAGVVLNNRIRAEYRIAYLAGRLGLDRESVERITQNTAGAVPCGQGGQALAGDLITA